MLPPSPDHDAREHEPLEAVLRDWLAVPDVALVAGRWRDGAILELILDGDATLSPPAYRGRFSGLRDLTLRGQRHHLHVDLARITRVTYAVVPSVCYGFRPSFEAHFGGDEGHAFSLSLLSPYRDDALDVARGCRYFALCLAHAAAHPDRVRFVAERDAHAGDHTATWHAVRRCLAEAAGVTLDDTLEGPEALCATMASLRPGTTPSRSPLPAVLAVLDAALALPGASLVVYRARTLVEFKTERLGRRVSAYEESGHRSWQIGDFDGHHCHLDLDAVTRAHFDAEPVSCQGNRLNWTVWFLGERDCGNPYRPEAVCSVTLNRPYRDDGSREARVVEAMYALYDRVSGEASVTASEAFLAARGG